MRITLDILERDGLFVIESPDHPDLFVASADSFAEALSRLPDCLEALATVSPQLTKSV